ncbi:MAG: 4-hydroxythreonine-4-phosphate dehydrogenase PdxA [Deltaproteobacteria bacterium]|nr:4-hydroxythreonine-4-phosphate dehydrogenase PdxA [Deltaproteobacteria bacterium]
MKPLLLIVGDPLSIGPEITVKALARPEAQGPLAVIGPVNILNRTAETLGLKPRFIRVDSLEHLPSNPQVIPVLEPPGDWSGLDALPMGRVHPLAGKASVEYVVLGARLALAGLAQALVTGPINKESVQQAGYHQFIGNTEILEQVCAETLGRPFAGKCLTMLISGGLRVAHVTRHVAFRDISAKLTVDKLLEVIRLTALGMVSLGLPGAAIAVAGLNPHNGDGGLMGDEESRVIAPAVAQAQAEGLKVEGPLPADSVFHFAIRGAYQAVVALYHDQGHIAIKTHGFEQSYSVSLALPIIRTSVDHGTAFNIAGQGLANETSLMEALAAARHIVAVNQWQVA